MANEGYILQWSTDFEARNSSISPLTTIPEVDLEYLLSKVASK
ncbi:hypothetical protein ERO13_A12G162500v2 [Gossypium hirsutum]|nr:hypothetical protein ERO13_A12G162500v2 [Gossypium hirsutum]